MIKLIDGSYINEHQIISIAAVPSRKLMNGPYRTVSDPEIYTKNYVSIILTNDNLRAIEFDSIEECENYTTKLFEQLESL